MDLRGRGLRVLAFVFALACWDRGTAYGASSPQAFGAPGQVNVNAASVKELKTIGGIGPALAKEIVRYRTANGPFRSLDDLSKVEGIGPKTLDRIRGQLTLK